MKSKDNLVIYNNSFSTITVIFAFFFSLYGLFTLYVEDSIYWLYIGISLVMALIRVLFGKKLIRKAFYMPFVPKLIQNIFSFAFLFGFFIGSVCGLANFIAILPINDKSIFLFPIIAISFIFAGSAIGVYNSK